MRSVLWPSLLSIYIFKKFTTHLLYVKVRRDIAPSHTQNKDYFVKIFIVSSDFISLRQHSSSFLVFTQSNKVLFEMFDLLNVSGTLLNKNNAYMWESSTSLVFSIDGSTILSVVPCLRLAYVKTIQIKEQNCVFSCVWEGQN